MTTPRRCYNILDFDLCARNDSLPVMCDVGPAAKGSKGNDDQDDEASAEAQDDDDVPLREFLEHEMHYAEHAGFLKL